MICRQLARVPRGVHTKWGTPAISCPVCPATGKVIFPGTGVHKRVKDKYDKYGLFQHVIILHPIVGKLPMIWWAYMNKHNLKEVS